MPMLQFAIYIDDSVFIYSMSCINNELEHIACVDDAYRKNEQTNQWFKRQSVRKHSYRKTSNISRTVVGNKIVDNSDVIGASPVGAAPTTSSFST